MLYQPNYCYPNQNAIDVTMDNTFSMKINGGKCVGYKITILRNDNNSIVYDSGKVDLTGDDIVYGNSDDESFLTISIPSSVGLLNGTDYKWKCRLYSDRYDNLITRGTVAGYFTADSKSAICVGANQKISEEMKVIINSQSVIVNGKADVANGTSILFLGDIFGTMSAFSSQSGSYYKATVQKNTNIQNGQRVTFFGLKNGYIQKPISRIISDVSHDTSGTNQKTYFSIQYSESSLVVNDYVNGMFFIEPTVSPLTVAPTENTPYIINSEYIDTFGYYFKARKTPLVSISNISDGDILTSNNYTFRGTYEVDSNNVHVDDGLQYYEFTLYDSSNNIIKYSGKNSSSDIKLDFDGFIPGNYSISLSCVSQNEMIAMSDTVNFSVDYAQSENIVIPKATSDCNKTAIHIDWSETKSITGFTEGTSPFYRYVKLNGSELNNNDNEVVITEPSPQGEWNGVHVLQGNSIYYNKVDSETPLEIPDEFTLCTYVTFDSDFEGEVISLSGSNKFCSLRFNGHSFMYTSDLVAYRAIDVYQTSDTLYQANSFNETLDKDTYFVWDDSTPLTHNGFEFTGFWTENDMIKKYFFNIIIKRGYGGDGALSDEVIIERGVKIV